MRKKLSLVLPMLLFFGLIGYAQDDTKEKSLEIYGFIMADIGYNFNQIQADWYDVVRPTKLPAFKNQYGTDGNVYFQCVKPAGFQKLFSNPTG